MTGRRIGVYVCHCGGNISDYVDVAAVVADVERDSDVVVARRAMFTCSDATQQEIVDDIREQRLDGLVVASCSPKLHTLTFRDVAKRADLNPYQYTQVNVREQCSWAHTDDRAGATDKAIRLVRAGIARTALTTALEPEVVDTIPRAVVIGGGVAGLRAAVGLADIGLAVYLVEKQADLGGWVGGFEDMFPNSRNGSDLIAELTAAVRQHPEITVFTDAEVISKSGSFGNYTVGIQVAGPRPATLAVEVGSIIVATGFDTYRPESGEFGYGIDGVLTLPEFKRLVDTATGPLTWAGRTVRSIAYVYCVGSRTDPGGTGVGTGQAGCSQYCCTAAAHASLRAGARDAGVRQYHLYRDIRTYGKHERLYSSSRRAGSMYLRFPDDDPPAISLDPNSGPETGRLTVAVRDLLADGEQIALSVDLVVLVTGMVPRQNPDLVRALKLPVGADGFLHEIHPKLRPVETVLDGVYLAGCCQGPKTAAESVTSALAAVAQTAAILKRGTAELDPMVAVVRPGACVGCDDCLQSCPYGAITTVSVDGREAAVIDPTGCKGCGGCVPICPHDAIDLLGYTDAQMIAMIDGLLTEPAPTGEPAPAGHLEPSTEAAR